MINNKRIKYIDALRGTTMILVVFAHVMLGMGIGSYGTVIGSFFVTFRMPMFFFISGYIAFKIPVLWDGAFYTKMMKKKAFVQIIPALIFFTLYSVINGRSPLSALHDGFREYWFTFVLFEMFCVYYFASLLGKYTHHVVTDGILILSSFGGIIWLMISDRIGWAYNFFCIENLAKYMQFFAFGVFSRKYSKFFLSLMKNDYVRAFLIVSFMTSFYFFFDEKMKANNPLLFSFNHDIVVRYMGLLTIFVFFMNNSSFFERESSFTRALLFTGRRTLDIYLLHNFFVPNLRFLRPYILGPNLLLFQLLIPLLVSLLVVGLSLLVSEVIRSSNLLAHYCFGVSRTYNPAKNG